MTTSSDEQYLDGGGVTAADETVYDGGSPIEAAVDAERDLGYPQLDRDAPETQQDVTPFTLAMYSFLPSFVKEADQVTNVEDGGWPFLKFLDAAGHIPDQIRAKVAAISAGRWTNPATVPEDSLRWLASLMGVPPSQKSVPPTQLRQALIDLVDNGQPADGTRGQIASAARQFLVGTREVSVGPATASDPLFTNTEHQLFTAMGVPVPSRLLVDPDPPTPVLVHRWDGTRPAAPSVRERNGQRTGENLVHNPRFSEDLTGWSTDADVTQTRDTTVSDGQEASARLDPIAAGWYWLQDYRDPVETTDHVIRFRVYSAVARTINVQVWKYDGGTTVAEPVALPAGTWTTVEMVTPLTVGQRYRPSIADGETVLVADPLWVDWCHVFRSRFPSSTYLDGDTPDSTSGKVWVDSDAGTAHSWDGSAWVASTGTEAQAQAVLDQWEEAERVRAHTITVVAKPDEIRQGDLAALAEQVRSVGVVPAGHSLAVATVTASWDEFESVVAAEGGTWDSWAKLAVVWTEEEAIGTTMDNPTEPTA